jgi:hypothetical protein
MPLSRQDCIDLSRQVERLLREYDPRSFELIVRSRDRNNDPRRDLVDLVRTVRDLYAERSGGMHADILDRVNHFVRLPDGGPIRGLSVVLTAAERELYGTGEVSLAELPDRGEFLAELDRIRSEIAREVDLSEDGG